MIEICANCGKIAANESDEFCCVECKSNVCVMVPKTTFQMMVKAGVARE